MKGHRCVKRWSASLDGTSVKTALRKRTGDNTYWHGWGKREPLCPAGGNVNWYSHYGKQYMEDPQKIKIELPYDRAIPLLGIYPRKMKILTRKDTYLRTTALFMSLRWADSECPTGRWADNDVCTYGEVVFSRRTSEEIFHLWQRRGTLNTLCSVK